ncbi:MAG TPA: histidine kinase [Bryobacteraceae bacterium]|nr:histidine kinase [Bryobacteraceae bacterium]
MPELLNIHEPLLINSICHSGGAVVFGLLLILLVRDSWVRSSRPPFLAAGAAFLAFGWNIASLLALSPSLAGSTIAAIAAAIGFACLSVLPALLLAISLKGAAPVLRAIGWIASATAVLLHAVELFTREADLHRLALLLIATVFTVLAVLSIRRVHAASERRRLVSGVLVPLALILFAGSFVHFGTTHAAHPWSEEIALHHAGIPLALFIVLQDYRFLLVDTFVRFLASGGLAAGLTLTCLAANEKWRLLEWSTQDPFVAGLLIVAACCSLILFAGLRGQLQNWLTQRVFHRPSLQTAISRLIEQSAMRSEEEWLRAAATAIAKHVSAEHMELHSAPVDSDLLLPEVVAASNGTLPPDCGWAEVVVPFRFSRGDSMFLLLGRRTGGRRYLSEDLRDIAQLALVAVSQVERFRSDRVERLVTEAELRALHAQINPHFLFNALNALYGTIPRSADGARRTVLNLAEVFRYFLQTERTTIALSEELRIVKAYLEIEQLRLGDRLSVHLDIDPGALNVRIPPLCIQPLVENAIKHGVAAKAAPGSVTLAVSKREDRVVVEVTDTGDGFGSDVSARGNGLGLENVRQRLHMMYGTAGQLRVASANGPGACVVLELPCVAEQVPAGAHSRIGLLR